MRNQTIVVDINKEICKILRYKQYDNNNLLQIIVEENYKKVNLKKYEGVALFQLPSGMIIKKDCEIQENVITIVIDNNILNEDGAVALDLTLSDGEETFTLFRITLTVEKSIDKDEAIIVNAGWDITAEILKFKIDEVQRQANEVQRVEKEEQRLKEEVDRQDEEIKRKANETQRLINEEQRISKENKRLTDEELRTINENKRLEKEEQRLNDEQKRISAEEIRLRKEIERLQSETDRNNSEMLRVERELERIEQERQRLINEEIRESNERKRQELLKETDVDKLINTSIRLDNVENELMEVNSQLAHNEYEISILKKEKVNVFDFGAVGDGVTDDSEAIQKAIDSLTDGGIVVFPPSHKYKITKQITVNQYVFLKGSEHMNERNIDKASVFYIYHGENEEDSCTFKMKISSGMSGFTFYYPNQVKEDALEPIPYAWTIDTTKETAGNTDNVYLENLMLRNSYQGIKLVNAGRFYLNNIQGHPIKTGIYSDDVNDVSRMYNIHFWPFMYTSGSNMYKWIYNNGTAFDLGNIDHVTITSAFAFGYNYGFKFFDGFWGGLVSCCCDVCNNPVHIYKVDQLRILGGAYTTTSVVNPIIFIHPELSGRCLIDSATLYGNTVFAIHCSADTGEVAITNCDFKNGYTENINGWRYAPILVDGDATVRVSNCLGVTDNEKIYGKNNVIMDGVKLLSCDTKLNLTNLDLASWADGKPSNWNISSNAQSRIEQISNGIRLLHKPLDNGSNVTSYISYPLSSSVYKSYDVYMLKLNINASKMSASSSGRFVIKICRTDGINICMNTFGSGYVPMKYSKEFILYYPIYFGCFKDASEIRIEWQSYGSDTGGYIDIKNIELYKCEPINMSNTQFDKIIRTKYTNPYGDENPFVTFDNKNKIIKSDSIPVSGTWNVGDRVYNTSYATNSLIGWVCITSGSPGSWKSFGTLI